MGCASSRGQGGCADFSLPGHADNEETEGSDVPADYLLGDVEADEDDLYMMDHENPHGERELLLSFGHPAGSSPALLYSFPVAFLAAEEQEYSLPQEAFPLRHEIVDNPSALDHLQDKADSPHVSGNEAETVSLTPVESFSLISISHSLSMRTACPPTSSTPLCVTRCSSTPSRGTCRQLCLCSLCWETESARRSMSRPRYPKEAPLLPLEWVTSAFSSLFLI